MAKFICVNCGLENTQHIGPNRKCPGQSTYISEDFSTTLIGVNKLVRGDSTKFDGGKIMFDLLPFAEVEDIARVLTYGAKKYEKDGWKTVPDGLDRYFAALMRHLTAYKSGEEIDTESGLTHLSHACTNLMFIMYLSKIMTKDSPLL